MFSGGTEFLTATKKTKLHNLKVPALVVPHEFCSVSTHPASTQTEASGVEKEKNTTTSSNEKRPVTMKDFVELVCRDLIVERHSMLVEPDGSM